MTKVLYFDDYTAHNFKEPCKLNTNGMKNWRFSTNISLYLANGTRYGHSYNGRPLTADGFAVSCIGLGWVGSIFLDLRWVGLGHSVDGLGWVGSSHPKWTHGHLCGYSCSKNCVTLFRCPPPAIRHLRRHVTDDCFRSLVVSLIHSRLDYGNFSLVGLPVPAYLVR